MTVFACGAQLFGMWVQWFICCFVGFCVCVNTCLGFCFILLEGFVMIIYFVIQGWLILFAWLLRCFIGCKLGWWFCGSCFCLYLGYWRLFLNLIACFVGVSLGVYLFNSVVVFFISYLFGGWCCFGSVLCCILYLDCAVLFICFALLFGRWWIVLKIVASLVLGFGVFDVCCVGCFKRCLFRFGVCELFVFVVTLLFWWL